MPTNKRKTVIIQVAAVLFALAVAFVAILYARGVFDFTFIDRPETGSGEDTLDTADPADTDRPDDTTADPAETTGTPGPDDGPAFMTYDEAMAAIASDGDAAYKGFKLYGGLYDPADCALVRTAADNAFSESYAVRDAQTRVVNRGDGWRGGISYTETTELKPRPVLTPYFGYLIYDDGSRLRLLDSKGKALAGGDVTDYQPTGYRDLAGNPLFKKGDIYYYYYDGAEPRPDTVVADRITADDIWQYPAAEYPDAYWNVDVVSEITPTLPDSAGMVECTVDPSYLTGVALPSSYESHADDTGIFRFCEHRILRTVTNQAQVDARTAEIEEWSRGVASGELPPDTPAPDPIDPVYREEDQGYFWGYLDANGNYVITPQYELAFDFSSEGLAVITDPEAPGTGRTIVINGSGSTVINAYRSVYYIAERGNARVRDSHFLPDTYGVESAGMLSFDRGMLRVRRRLLEGSSVVSETEELINTRGQLFALPGGYRLVGYSDGVALLEKDGLYGYLDYTGRWIVQPVLTYAAPFSEGLAAAGYEGHVGLIDTSGKVVLPMVFTYVTDCSDGVVAAFAEGHGWTLYNKISKKEYTEPSNPILAIKKRLLTQAAYDEQLAAVTGQIAG